MLAVVLSKNCILTIHAKCVFVLLKNKVSYAQLIVELLPFLIFFFTGRHFELYLSVKCISF